LLQHSDSLKSNIPWQAVITETLSSFLVNPVHCCRCRISSVSYSLPFRCETPAIWKTHAQSNNRVSQFVFLATFCYEGFISREL